MEAMNEEREEKERSGRWLRREKRRRSERERLQKHGASLRRVYIDAVRKRIQARKTT